MSTQAQSSTNQSQSKPRGRPDIDMKLQRKLVQQHRVARRAACLDEWKHECTIVHAALPLADKARAHKLLVTEAKRHQLLCRERQRKQELPTKLGLPKEGEFFDLIDDKTHLPRLLEDVDVLMTLPDDTIPKATPWNCPELLQRNYFHTRKELLRLDLWTVSPSDSK